MCGEKKKVSKVSRGVALLHCSLSFHTAECVTVLSIGRRACDVYLVCIAVPFFMHGWAEVCCSPSNADRLAPQHSAVLGCFAAVTHLESQSFGRAWKMAHKERKQCLPIQQNLQHFGHLCQNNKNKGFSSYIFPLPQKQNIYKLLQSV